MAMTDDQLKQYLPKYGDRIAVLNFCKKDSSSSRKNSLLDRLRKKMHKQKKSKCTPDSSESDEAEATNKKPQKKKKAERLIEIEWFCGKRNEEPKQIRTKCGGGTRQISVPQHFTKNDIMVEAINLFFPDGVSPKGPKNLFDFDLWDFKSNVISNSITVEELFRVTGLTKLRFYLASIEINQEESCSKDLAPSTSDSEPTLINYYSTFEEDGELFPEVMFSDAVLSVPTENFVGDIASPEQVPTDILCLMLHRGQIFEEMVSFFMNVPLTRENIQVEILENGKRDSAIDTGGVLRDALSEFWNSFYDRCTSGTQYKVPFVRHDIRKDQWRAIAKVLYKGYVDCHYFPMKMARCFMEQCIFGTTHKLLDSLLLHISIRDFETLQNALKDFGSVDVCEVTEILQLLDSRWVPTAENLHTLLTDIAHKELIQKPLYVILSGFITAEELFKLYEQNKSNPKNILGLLEFSEENTVKNVLKRFVRESSDEYLERLTTGANMLTGEKISVTFKKSSGLERSPIGRTCSSTLELSVNYDNYPEFRSELNSVLESNIWVMDIA